MRYNKNDRNVELKTNKNEDLAFEERLKEWYGDRGFISYGFYEIFDANGNSLGVTDLKTFGKVSGLWSDSRVAKINKIIKPLNLRAIRLSHRGAYRAYRRAC